MLKSSDVDVVCYWPAWSLTAMLEDLVVLLQFDVTFEDDTVSLWLAMAGVPTSPLYHLHLPCQPGHSQLARVLAKSGPSPTLSSSCKMSRGEN